MNTLKRKTFAITGLLALGLLGTLSANAAEGVTPSSQGDSPICQQEIRRVAVWPHGPDKGLQVPRYESRTLTACHHDKVTSKPTRSASGPSFGPRTR